LITKKLRTAIEKIIDEYEGNAIDELEKAFTEEDSNKTDTMMRIEYLHEKLEEGLSKRAAARALSQYDPRISSATAETLVYTVFSGLYQTTKRERRGSLKQIQSISAPLNITIPVTSDEDLL
jgi:hypothetical protein